MQGKTTVIAVLIASSSALAQPTGTLRCVWTDDTHTVARLESVETGTQYPAVSSMYDNWSDPVFFGGRTLRVGLQRIADHEVADDFIMTQSGRLSAMYRSVANMDAPGSGSNINRTTVQTRWYDAQSGSILREYTYELHFGLAGMAGTSWNVLQDDGYWSFLNLELPARIMYSERETNVVGASPESIGRITAGPNTIGASTRFIHDYTAGQDIDLGSDQVNLLLAVRATPIPTPAALATLIAAACAAIRRRR